MERLTELRNSPAGVAELTASKVVTMRVPTRRSRTVSSYDVRFMGWKCSLPTNAVAFLGTE